MKSILNLLALALFLCSTTSAFQGGAGESTKNPKPRSTARPRPTSVSDPSSKKKQSIRTLAKVTNVKMPKELILQMGRDNDDINSCLQEYGGYSIKLTAENFSAKLLDLNRDGKPEWMISGEPGTCGFCGNRTCAGWIYREVAGKYELLLADRADPLSTFTNGYKDLQAWFPTIYTYDGQRYKEGYDFTLDQIIEPSKLEEIQKLVCNESKKRLVRAKQSYRKDDKENSWYDKGMLEVSYEDGWQEKVRKEYSNIQLEKFKVSNNGISFYYDTTIGFPMAILSEEPSSEYFYSWAVLKPYLLASSPISNLTSPAASSSIAPVSTTKTSGSKSAKTTPSAAIDLGNAAVIAMLESSWNFYKREEIFLGPTYFGNATNGRGLALMSDYLTYQALAAKGLIKLDELSLVDAPKSEYGSTVSKGATVSMTEAGSKLGKVDTKENTVTFVFGTYRVEKIESNTIINTNAGNYRLVTGTHLLDIAPAFGDIWTNLNWPTYRERRFRAIFVYEGYEFTRSDGTTGRDAPTWHVATASNGRFSAEDVGPRNGDFDSNNVPPTLDQLRVRRR